jgi:hypothetical protein
MKDKSRKIFDTIMTKRCGFLKFPLGGGVAARQWEAWGVRTCLNQIQVYEAVSEDSFVPKFRIEEDRVTRLCRLIPWTQR